MSNKKGKVEKDTTERWLLTYADLMNLLLIFFIILYAMSQLDQAKYEDLRKSLTNVFGFYETSSGSGILPGDGSNIPIDLDGSNMQKPTPTPTTGPNGEGSGTDAELQEMNELKNTLEGMIKENGEGENISVSIEDRGVKISIMAQFLFASGSADLTTDVLQKIIEIGNMLKSFPDNYLRIEGHTDTDPIRTNLYPSNWELSSARATNVVRLMVEQCGLDPKRISAVGYGEYQPAYPNDTDGNKAKNRRIDIILLKKDFAVGEAGSEAFKPD